MCKGGCKGCCTRCKNCMGRMPWASLLAAVIMVAAFTMLLIALEVGLKKLDEAMKMIGIYDGDYSTYRNLISTIMRISCYATYGFVGFFLLIAFLCSGKNRDCLEKKKCCRRNIIFFVIIISIILVILFILTLLSTAVMGVPLAVATMTSAMCTQVEAGVNLAVGYTSKVGVACLDLSFLGATNVTLCDNDPNLDHFCDLMTETTASAWVCWVALLLAVIGLVIAIAAYTANFAYLKSIKGEDAGGKKSGESEPLKTPSKSGTYSYSDKMETPRVSLNSDRNN